MYKVFFNERKVFLTTDFLKSFQENHGLFYKFNEKEELKELLLIFLAINRIKSLFIYSNDLEDLKKNFVSCFRYVEAAGGLVMNKKNGKLLFINRFDKWDLPKGKIEEGETPEGTAIREVEEECGISGVTISSALMCTYHTYFFKNTPHLKKTHWFRMEYSGRENPAPQTGEFITKVMWAGPKEIKMVTRNTYGSIIDLLEEAGVQ